MPLKALLFDVDGTLAETEKDGHRPAFNKAFAAKGLDWNWDVELYGRLLKVTGGKERIKYYMDTFRPAKTVDEAAVAELHIIKTQFYTDAVALGEVPLRPGVHRLLEQARESGLRLAIATTTTPANITALLKTHFGAGALEWFEFIGAGDMVPRKKPDPEIYQLTLQTMQLKPYECIAFEDSHNGLLASTQAGIPTLVTPSYYTRMENFAGAALIVSHLGEPDQAFKLLSGESFGTHYVSIELLKQLQKKYAE